MTKRIQGMLCTDSTEFPMTEIRKQHGLKRDIVKLVLNAATPDDDCMLCDFLMALQFILDKHGVVSARP